MKDWIEQNQLTEVECIIPDLAGAARGKIVPAAKFVGTNNLRMPQSVLMQSVTGDYPHIREELNPLDVDMKSNSIIFSMSSAPGNGSIYC